MSQLWQNIQKEKDTTKLFSLLNKQELELTRNHKRDNLLFIFNQIIMTVIYIIGVINVYVFSVSEHSVEILSANIPIIKSVIEFSPKFQAPFWIWLAIVCLVPPVVTRIIKAITKVFVRKPAVEQIDTNMETKTASDVLLKLKKVRGKCFTDDRVTPTIWIGSLVTHLALTVLFLVYKSELHINAVFGFLLAMVLLWFVMGFINLCNISFSGATPCIDIALDKLIVKFEAYAKEEEQARIAEEQAIEQAKKQKEEEIKQAEKMKKAAELYAQATRGNETNMELLIQAADMGNPAACKKYGKMLFLETDSDLYTNAEKEDKYKTAAAYLANAKDNDIEAEFLWLACRVKYEINDIDEWKEMLQRVRTIKASGKMEASFNDAMNSMIQLLVQTIDRLAAKQKNGHYYCRFYNAGICNHQSNGYHIHKCTDPVNQSCTHALLNHGIVYGER